RRCQRHLSRLLLHGRARRQRGPGSSLRSPRLGILCHRCRPRAPGSCLPRIGTENATGDAAGNCRCLSRSIEQSSEHTPRETAFMKVNPFYDSWHFLLGRTADHGNAGPFVAWLLTLGFLALIAASVWIARMNWRDDPSQRTPQHLATWAMRFFIGT